MSDSVSQEKRDPNPKSCSCHEDDRPPVCSREHAHMHCWNVFLHKEVDRLKEKCDKQANVLRQLTPERFPGAMFIHAHVGERDMNGMPEKLIMVPSYGSDVTYIYERKD